MSMTFPNLSRQSSMVFYIFYIVIYTKYISGFGECSINIEQTYPFNSLHYYFVYIITRQQLLMNSNEIYASENKYNKYRFEMDNFNYNQQSHSHQMEENKKRLDFYRLHYPSRKSPQSVSKASNKMRSKSVISVIQTNQNEQKQKQVYNPKGSIRKLVANKSIKSHSMFLKDKKQAQKYKESLTFKTVLSSKTSHRDLSTVILPFNSLKQIEQLSKRSVNVKLALQKSRDEKIKMNKIVMSHKQNEEVKLDYLRNKRDQVQNMINQEINGIYCQFFKKEYELLYGPEDGEDKFQEKLAELVSTLSQRVFNSGY